MISVASIILSVVLFMTGIYLVCFPISFRSRIVKASNTCIRSLGFLVIALGIAIAGQAMQRLLWTSDAPSRTQWFSFCKREGFLTSKGLAIDMYSEAVQVLAVHSIDRPSLENEQVPNASEPLPGEALNKFIEFVTAGAKVERFGIAEAKPLSTEFYTIHGARFDIENIRLLSEAMKHFASDMLRKADNVETALLLGKVNIALGTQLSAHDTHAIRMVGIACRKKGLDTIQECAEYQKNETLLRFVKDMSEILDHDFKAVRKAFVESEPETPSFWELLRLSEGDG